MARVMRMPGLQNQKPGRESWRVTWGRYGGRKVVPDDVGRVPEVERRREPRRAAKRETVTERISRSERDWAWVRSELRQGSDPEVLRRELEQRRPDKPSPTYYARRTVDRAVESLQAERGR